MDILKQFPSRYLNVEAIEDLGGEVTYTVTSIEIEDMKNAGQSEKKPVMSFKETKQGLVLNKSNAITLAESLGTNTAKWIGKKVVLRLENWGPSANRKRWIAAYAAGEFMREHRPPSATEAAVAAAAPLDDLDDDISDI